MDLKTRYKVKGVGSEQTIESVIKIHTTPSGDRITKVEDRWNGNIPEGAFAKVSLFQLLNPFWWVGNAGIVGFWCWSLVWWTQPWELSGEKFLEAAPSGWCEWMCDECGEEARKKKGVETAAD